MSRKRWLVTAMAGACVCQGLFASELLNSDEAVQHLDKKVVYGGSYRNTATKSSLSAQETPQGFSVINRDLLDMRGADSINEALRYVPGVISELRGGAVTRIDQFTIRGFQNYQNSYDGLQLLFNDWNLQPQIDAVAIEQVEVFKGPTSVLYGAMPPGGMVNLIAQSPSSAPHNSVKINSGNQDLKKISANSGGQLGYSDVSYNLVALASKKQGQAVTSDEERYLIAPSFDWQLSSDTLINFNVLYQNDPSAGIYNTVPGKGSVLKNINGKLPTDFYAGDANWNTYEREVALYGYKINHVINDTWSFLHNARYMNATAYQENTYSTGLSTDERTLDRRAYLTDEKSEGVTIDNQLAAFIHSGDAAHNILLGLDYLKLRSGIKYEDAVTDSIDLFTPDNFIIEAVALDFSASGYSSDFDIEREQMGVYLQDQVQYENFILIVGGRYDNYRQTEKGVKYSTQTSVEVDHENFSGRLAGLYKFDNGLSPFISYAESFEPVTGSDRHGATFDPATSHQWETGLKFNTQDEFHTASVSVFQIVKENDTTRDPTGTAYDKIQTGEVRSKGVELEVASQASKSLTLLFNYTFMDMEVTQDNNGLQGKTPIRVAENSASFWADYDVHSGILAGAGLGLGVRYTGDTKIDALNTDTVPAYTLVDLAFTYDLGLINAEANGVKLAVSMNNLLGERYTTCFDENNCWFGAERTVAASAEYRF
ncbi:MAG: TonB-dependent siderophore receptor [Bermanella sp.]